MKTSTPIDLWFEILNWKRLPNFGACHTIDEYDRFMENFFLSDELKRLKTNLLVTLTGDFEIQNIKFMGRPGCGKTSFINYMIKEAETGKNEILSRYVFYVLYANRADPDDLEVTIQSYLLEAWGKYFEICGHSDVFHRIMDRGTSNKSKINVLTDYFKKNKSDFDKIMIFIIDNTDLVSDEIAYNITHSVSANLSLGLVKKWLVLREATYDGYGSKTRNLVDAFFSDNKIFPHVSLYSIIDHRIKGTTGSKNPKNPFSPELCDLVLERLLDGNFRRALSVLKNILEESPPGDLQKHIDEKVIRNYFNKNLINNFIKLNILPNLYDPIYRSTSFPLPIDILKMNKHIKFPELLYGAVYQVSRIRAEKARIVEDYKYIKIREDDFQYSLERIINLGLAVKSGKAIEQTKKGSLLSDYIDRKHYIDVCRKLTKEPYSDEIFCKLIDTKINHQKIALDMISWDKPIGG